MQPFLWRVGLIRQCPKPVFCSHAGAVQYSALTIRHAYIQRRELSSIPTMLIPPVVFGGLVVALWTWKCLMMVVFQNKIIYMPGLPPNARRETIEDYKSHCCGIAWREEKITSVDGTRISLCVASVMNGIQVTSTIKTVYILYFQGNASSIPPRLPFLSPVLRSLRDRHCDSDDVVRYTMVCCSYRGFWTSRGRPSEKGIAMDAVGALKWIENESIRCGDGSHEISLVIWGQSIGAGVASNLATKQQLFAGKFPLNLLILETPFISVRAMLETLYPQKWLPYRYLGPFLRNHLDSLTALELMSQRYGDAGIDPPQVLILEAGKDELVPKLHGDALEAVCRKVQIDVRRRVISNALHTEVIVRPEGRVALVQAIVDVSKGRKPD